MNDDIATLYQGTVVHRRLKPKPHLLRYRVFSLLLDLDRLAEIDKRSWLFGVNRGGILSFLEKDHGDGRRKRLADWVRAQLRAANLYEDGLRIRALCYPRFFGYVFNPLTVYFCERGDGTTAAILYQVNNTMGERHTYVIPAGTDGANPTLRHSCDKAMYVSPFTPMQGRYDFSIRTPGDDICVAIRQSDAEGPVLNASFVGRARPFDTARLFGAILRHPLMTLKIIAGIHLEAFKLWRKGVPVFKHQPQTRGTITIVPADVETQR